jgi:hypothetical protein
MCRSWRFDLRGDGQVTGGRLAACGCTESRWVMGRIVECQGNDKKLYCIGTIVLIKKVHKLNNQQVVFSQKQQPIPASHIVIPRQCQHTYSRPHLPSPSQRASPHKTHTPCPKAEKPPSISLERTPHLSHETCSNKANCLNATSTVSALTGRTMVSDSI